MKRNLTVSVLSSVLACVVLVLIIARVGAQSADGRTAQPIGPEMLTGTPISSTFTYQGQLKSGGSAVTGPCDFQFGLWDAASGGAQVGVTQTLSAVNVSNGLFTVPLNFGANAFTGDARWLSMAVRCPAGSGNYAPLDPRQALTPAPYATYASGNWSLNGNRGTGASNFLGTTDNTKLTLAVSNTTALRLIPNANAPILIGGYAGNTVNGVADGSIIAGGGSAIYGANIISGTSVGWSTIGGGFNNQIREAAVNTVIGGGYANQINGYNTDHSSIGGGWINHIGGGAYDSAIGNGDSNEISGNADHSAIGSGLSNQITGTAGYSAIGSGESNLINGGADHSAIGGGYQNQISGAAYYSAINGGEVNQISANASNSAIGSGAHNQIGGSAYDSAIGSGISNQISGTASFSVIGGGDTNVISGAASYSAIGSGITNQIGGNAYRSIIGGGNTNQITGTANTSVIGGGLTNKISGNAYNSTISGGNTNQIGGNAGNAAIGGGASNVISGTNTAQSTIGGGGFNTISGTTATIPGGYGNTAAGNYSFAAGTQAKANHTGAFVWGDNTFADFASTGNNQFLIRASGGVGIGTNAPGAQLDVASSGSLQLRLNQTNVNDYARLEMSVGGAPGQSWDMAAISTTFTLYSGKAGQNALQLTPGSAVDYMTMGNGAHLTAGGTWTNASDRNLKTNFQKVDGRAVLAQVNALPISSWNYKVEPTTIRHVGPMAQDFYAAFGLGADNKSITTVDEGGIALAAIQGLYQENQDLKARVAQLEQSTSPGNSTSSTEPFNLSNLLSVIAIIGVAIVLIQQRKRHGGQA